MSIPLGATWDGSGTRFAVWSGVAVRLELCLFSPRGRETRLPMTREADGTWHTYVPGAQPGQRYGYRVHGRWDPAGSGALCDPARLLLDPYARAIHGEISWHPSLFPGARDDHSLSPAQRDTAPFTPRSIVVDPHFDWADDRPPRRPLAESVIYEVHVKGFTARHPKVPARLRGTYAGLAHPAAVDHLVRLGVTAVELLPIHHFVSEARLTKLGLRNYWGYDSIGFFAPHAALAAGRKPGAQVREFKAMVRALHAAGIEVILDVVYNHTGEGGGGGPILSFKGLDNAAVHRLQADAPYRYQDFTACGNTLDARSPVVQRLVLDSLRCWVDEMHVDGFRFDLAAVLGRGTDAFDPHHPLLEAIRSDPVLATVKLIAEPWDPGPDGYQAGRFPTPWSEWNDRFRDTVRDLWRGALPSPADLGYRLTGSRDRFGHSERPPTASVNYVTAHDGFTLADLAAYDQKHNLANGEENRDGADQNRSWNHGVEGPTDDPAILAARARTRRNLLAVLLLSQGVPMLLGGDEIGRTQSGNNNAYCQDNEISWLDWAGADRDLLAFTRRLVAFRRAHPALRRRHWVGDATPHPVGWFTHDGKPMSPPDWESGPCDGLMLRLGDERLVDSAGRPLPADPLLLVVHAAADPHRFRLPDAPVGCSWQVALDTAASRPFAARRGMLKGGDLLDVDGRSVVVLRGVAARRRPRPG